MIGRTGDVGDVEPSKLNVCGRIFSEWKDWKIYVFIIKSGRKGRFLPQDHQNRHQHTLILGISYHKYDLMENTIMGLCVYVFLPPEGGDKNPL